MAGAVRTPIGKFGGGLADTPATTLGGVAIRAAVERSGLPTGTAPVISATRPLEFAAALKAGDGPAPLAELGGKRTVWVLGNTTTVAEWKMVIARLMDVWEDEIMTIQLQPAPPQPMG